MFKKILIANRGEIAARVIRTARRLGVATVSVYSDADRNARHVGLADEAVHIGPPPVSESYLQMERIIEAAKTTGAEAIHPGFGFLSENPDFVEKVKAVGLTFIGPSAASIRAMGLKDAAKALMENAGVPVVPGYHGENQDAAFLKKEAERIGYPVLIKARAGGGGKGMRKVDDPADFEEALKSAKREGEASFGDPAVLIEKYITAPRHIEVQVFGDSHGNHVHFFERDCSLQRRHQKVIEEAPAPGMPEAMRASMTNAAVKAAKAIDYEGAGTIEFIADGSELRPDGFWFMEMNTRLQVEHPVTEEITGVDLVEWQLRVASGEPVPLLQDDITFSGHAFEARLYAEDPANDFLPATGTLSHLDFPNDARIETGVGAGDAITPFYDPMIAKVITYAGTRDEALSKLTRALSETIVIGSVTNRAFLKALSEHEGFRKGNVDTGLIARDYEDLVAAEAVDLRSKAIAALFAARLLEPVGDSLGARLSDWRLWGRPRRPVRLLFGGDVLAFDIFREGASQFEVTVDDEALTLEVVEPLPCAGSQDGNVRISDDGYHFSARLIREGKILYMIRDGTIFEFSVLDGSEVEEGDLFGSLEITAPMPGAVTAINVNPGDQVEKGMALATMEAMKMEHRLTAEIDGRVKEVMVKVGEQVEKGAVLIALEEAE
ncbi:MAG: acetyl/propionyl/methylcrotonyl-CoA carboxylase subunit alpha [Pseudomonadota bacterium]